MDLPLVEARRSDALRRQRSLRRRRRLREQNRRRHSGRKGASPSTTGGAGSSPGARSPSPPLSSPRARAKFVSSASQRGRLGATGGVSTPLHHKSNCISLTFRDACLERQYQQFKLGVAGLNRLRVLALVLVLNEVWSLFNLTEDLMAIAHGINLLVGLVVAVLITVVSDVKTLSLIARAAPLGPALYVLEKLLELGLVHRGDGECSKVVSIITTVVLVVPMLFMALLRLDVVFMAPLLLGEWVFFVWSTVEDADATCVRLSDVSLLIFFMLLLSYVQDRDARRDFLVLHDTRRAEARAVDGTNTFMRYIFHEVRVPFNALFLGLEYFGECLDSMTGGAGAAGTGTGTRMSDNDDDDADYDDDDEYCENGGGGGGGRGGGRGILLQRDWRKHDANVAEMLDTLQVLNSQAEVIRKILEDALSLQKLERGQLELSYRPMSMYKLVHSVVWSHRNASVEGGVDLEFVVEPNVPPFTIGDEQRLRQVLQNFISNAIKFTNYGGSVSVTAKVASTHVCEAKLDHYLQWILDGHSAMLTPGRSTKMEGRSGKSRSRAHHLARKAKAVAKAQTKTEATAGATAQAAASADGSRVIDDADKDSHVVTANSSTDTITNPITNAALRSANRSESSSSDDDDDDDDPLEDALWIMFSVKDTGIGITEEDQQLLFQPFVNIKGEEHGKGSGLGLNIARLIVELHGGFVELDSEVGMGSEFRFFIPMKVVDPREIVLAQREHEMQQAEREKMFMRQATAAPLVTAGSPLGADGVSSVASLPATIPATTPAAIPPVAAAAGRGGGGGGGGGGGTIMGMAARSDSSRSVSMSPAVSPTSASRGRQLCDSSDRSDREEPSARIFVPPLLLSGLERPASGRIPHSRSLSEPHQKFSRRLGLPSGDGARTLDMHSESGSARASGMGGSTGHGSAWRDSSDDGGGSGSGDEQANPTGLEDGELDLEDMFADVVVLTASPRALQRSVRRSKSGFLGSRSSRASHSQRNSPSTSPNQGVLPARSLSGDYTASSRSGGSMSNAGEGSPRSSARPMRIMRSSQPGKTSSRAASASELLALAADDGKILNNSRKQGTHALHKPLRLGLAPVARKQLDDMSVDVGLEETLDVPIPSKSIATSAATATAASPKTKKEPMSSPTHLTVDVGLASVPPSRDVKCILVVEDSLVNQKLMRKILTKPHIHVLVASNGKEVVDMYEANMNQNIDMMFMDNTMPVMTGTEATRILRQMGVRIPIIALTGNALLDDKEAFMQAGVDCILTKPAGRAKLESIVEEYLYRPSTPRLLVQ